MYDIIGWERAYWGIDVIIIYYVEKEKYVYIDGILPKSPTCLAYPWQIGPFRQDTLDMFY